MPVGINGNGVVTGVAAGNAGFGRVVQMVAGNVSVAGATFTTSSLVASSITASITPLSASNRLIVTLNGVGNIGTGGAGASFLKGIYAVRKGTETVDGDNRETGFASPTSGVSSLFSSVASTWNFTAGSTALTTFTLYGAIWFSGSFAITNVSINIMEIAA